jgi:hypothetical protein
MPKRRKKPQPREGNSVRDKYLRQKFNITEQEYNQALKEQDGRCKGCGYLPTTRSLHVDHDHQIAGMPIDSEKAGVKNWRAYPKGFWPFTAIVRTPLHFYCSAETKPKALAMVRRKLLRLSVRGLVCWQCNSSIKKLRDSWNIAYNLFRYLWECHQFLDAKANKRNGFTE